MEARRSRDRPRRWAVMCHEILGDIANEDRRCWAESGSAAYRVVARNWGVEQNKGRFAVISNLQGYAGDLMRL